MTDTQIPAGPWAITPDARLPFDLRVHSREGLAICKVYGRDAQPCEELATALAALPQLLDALKFYAKSWDINSDGDASTPDLSRSWMEPSEALMNDEGAKAMNALMAAGIIKTPELPE